MPPPNPSGPPPVLKSAEAKGLAEKALAAMANKDSEAIRACKKQAEENFGKAISAGSGVSDNDYGLLLGPLTNAENGNWTEAEKFLREIVNRSDKPVSP
jgi:hypothetical protein